MEVEYLKVRLVYQKEPCVKFLCRCPLPKNFSIPDLKMGQAPVIFNYAFSVIRGGENDEIIEVVYIEA